MKTFLGVFVICYVLGFLTLLFFGGRLLTHFGLFLAVLAFFPALFYTLIDKQGDRIDELENRVRELEEKVQNMGQE